MDFEVKGQQVLGHQNGLNSAFVNITEAFRANMVNMYFLYLVSMFNDEFEQLFGHSYGFT